MTKMEMPTGIFDKLRKLPELSKMTDIAPKLQKSGPVTEIIEESHHLIKFQFLKHGQKMLANLSHLD